MSTHLFQTWHQLRFRNNNVQKDKYSVPEFVYDIIGILILTKKESQLVLFMIIKIQCYHQSSIYEKRKNTLVHFKSMT